MSGQLAFFCAEWRRLRKVLAIEEDLLYEFVYTAPSWEHVPVDSSSEFVQANALQGWIVEVEQDLFNEIRETFESEGQRHGRSPMRERSPTWRRSTTAALGAQSPRRSCRSPSPGRMTRSPTLRSIGGANTVSPTGPTRPMLFKNPAHPLATLPEVLGRNDFVTEMRKRLHAQPLFEAPRKGTDDAGEASGTGECLFSVEECEDLFDVLVQLQKIAVGASSGGFVNFGEHMDETVDTFQGILWLRFAIERGAPSLNAFLSGLEAKDSTLVDATLLRQFLVMVNYRLESQPAGDRRASRSERGFTPRGAMPEILPLERIVKAHSGVELSEFRRHLSFAAPVGVSLNEVQGHLEVKHGYGRAKLPGFLESAQLMEHLVAVEHLDISPLDLSRFFRIWGGPVGGQLNPAQLEEHLQRLPLEADWGLEPFAVEQTFNALGLRCLQLERHKKKDACLPAQAVLELTRSEDGEKVIQPPEKQLRERFEALWSLCVGEGMWTLPSAEGDNFLQDKADKVDRAETGLSSKDKADKVDRAETGSSSKDKADKVDRAETGSSSKDKADKVDRAETGSSSKDKADKVDRAETGLSFKEEREKEATKGSAKMKEVCQDRFVEAARQLALQPVSRLQFDSIFPNVSDVLAVSNVNLRAGQVVVVRYRLAGACNFWHPNHRVLKDEREPLPWPVPMKVLGETPFVALVPRGLRWTNAGGGGFYAGSQAFNQVDPGLRADLPLDAQGKLLLYGTVEFVAPYLLRGMRRNASSATEELEFRLFSSRKNRIIGCVGEPLRVLVSHQAVPPAVATLQVCCDGRNAKLRWAGYDLSEAETQTEPRSERDLQVEALRLNVRTSRKETLLDLDPETKQYEMTGLQPDTNYEFRLRLESRAGAGREATCRCRTNARTSQPLNVTSAGASTTYVDLQWRAPEVVGNERTQDRWQLGTERIVRYEALLSIAEAAAKERKSLLKSRTSVGMTESSGSHPTSSRPCSWDVDAHSGPLSGRLGGLRPDTLYLLTNFSAVNSMGPGTCAKDLQFWTMPLRPVIEGIRVRQGQVLLTLLETGGQNVNDLETVVRLESNKKESSFTLPKSALHGEKMNDLPLDFQKMPESWSGDDVHSIRIRARNPGGWSTWSEELSTSAIARQQGADYAQQTLEQAMERRVPEKLEQVLQEVRDIEFEDKGLVSQATELLEILQDVQKEVEEAMAARDPERLTEALSHAHEVLLPGLEQAEELLKTLNRVCHNLDTARGIDALRAALREGHEARLPAPLLQRAVQRLGTREAAQQGLEMAIEAARVPVVTAALETARDMHLPSEEKARTLLGAISHSEKLLQAALLSQSIHDLEHALDSAATSGLREDDLIMRAQRLLAQLVEIRSDAEQQLEDAIEARLPSLLREALDVSGRSQVDGEKIQEAADLLEELEFLLSKLEAAVGSEERAATLQAAHVKVPRELLAAAEKQLNCLNELHKVLAAGDVPATRRALKLAEVAGVKDQEIAEAHEVQRTWEALTRELEIAVSMGNTQRLRKALDDTDNSGISQEQLKAAQASLSAFQRSDAAYVDLEEAIETCDAEIIHKSLVEACNNNVCDSELISSAREILDNVLFLRQQLLKAVESMDLQRVHAAVEAAQAHEGLPDKDLSMAFPILEELRDLELQRLERHLKQAAESCDFRALDALLHRAEHAKHLGVEVEQLDLEHYKVLAQKHQISNIRMLQDDLQRYRLSTDWPAVLDQPEEDEEEAPPEVVEVVPLPSVVVAGQVQLDLHPRGIRKEFLTLPREIVEAKVKIALPDTVRDDVEPVMEARARLEELTDTIQAMLSSEDELRRIGSMEIQDDGAYRHVTLNIALYLSASTSSQEIIEAFFQKQDAERESAPSKELPGAENRSNDAPPAEGAENRSNDAPPAEGAENRSNDAPPAEGAENRSNDAPPAEGSLASTVYSRTLLRSKSVNSKRRAVKGLWACLRKLGHTRPELNSHCLSDVRGRVLRRITCELFWTQPVTYRETMDATCIAMTADGLVEVVNARGVHGAQYGVDQNSFRVQSKGVDALFGAVSHLGTERTEGSDMQGSADGKMMCKQIMQVRLDLLPERVTDLFFVLAATNSRELGKFTQLGFRVVDSHIGATLAMEEEHRSQLTFEAVVIMCAVYKLGDGYWRIGSMNVTCSGSPRDLKAALSKLEQLGFPRRHETSSQEHLVVESVRRYLELPRSTVKAANVNIDSSNTMTIQYAIEVLETDDVDATSRGEELRERLRNGLQGAILEEMFKFTNEKVKPERLRVLPAITKSLSHLFIEVKWEFGEVKRTDNKDHSYLDGALVTFAGRSLQEVVDYRGPHGVRIVHNGVVDYNGMWVGPVRASDAADGAIKYGGLVLDELPRTGKCLFEVHLDRLPPATTDVYVLVSSPSGRELSKYSNIVVAVVDAWKSHKVSTCFLKSKPASQGVIFCRLSKSSHGWKMGAFRSPSPGGCHNFHPILERLRDIQAQHYPENFEISLGGTLLRSERRLLPLRQLRAKGNGLQRQESTGSITSLLTWSPARNPNSRRFGPSDLD